MAALHRQVRLVVGGPQGLEAALQLQALRWLPQHRPGYAGPEMAGAEHLVRELPRCRTQTFRDLAHRGHRKPRSPLPRPLHGRVPVLSSGRTPARRADGIRLGRGLHTRRRPSPVLEGFRARRQGHARVLAQRHREEEPRAGEHLCAERDARQQSAMLELPRLAQRTAHRDDHQVRQQQRALPHLPCTGPAAASQGENAHCRGFSSGSTFSTKCR